MSSLRNPFKTQEVLDAHLEADALLTPQDEVVLQVIPDLLQGVGAVDAAADVDASAVSVSQSLWDDSGLHEWAHDPRNAILVGGGKMLWEIIRHPTSDVMSLKDKHIAMASLPSRVCSILHSIKHTEKDVLWLYTLPELKDAWPLNMLFPMFPVGRLINHVPPALTLFQFYKSTITPLMSMAVPISTFVGPWLYVRRTLKINLSFKKYCKMMYMALKAGMAPSNSLKTNVYSYFSLFVYIVFYIYGLIQTFQSAAMMRKMLASLEERMTNIREFVATAHELIDTVPTHCISAYVSLPGVKELKLKPKLTIPNGMSGFYKLATNKAAQEQLRVLCNVVWALDACAASSRLLTRGCCKVKLVSAVDGVDFVDGTRVDIRNNYTRFWNMGHVSLMEESKSKRKEQGQGKGKGKGGDQVRNPASLEKSLIITGPNAAGKSTYVRALLTNILLSQSLGIACARRAEVVPVHALGTFMRIVDQLGTASLFEAEVKRCAELIAQAEATSAAGQRATYFLDEPMHSTPPVEGSATSKAVIEYIGKLPGVRVLVTTHYHDIVTMDPDYFHNISMDAHRINGPGNGQATYTFPYKIQCGASFKCIALELLEKNQLPSVVVNNAIRIKNELIARRGSP